jgi:hypothetical protein
MSNSAYTSLVLKLSGVIFIVSALFDFISFAIPLQWQDVQWQIRFVTAIVDRGIVPMLGMMLILVGLLARFDHGGLCCCQEKVRSPPSYFCDCYPTGIDLPAIRPHPLQKP